MIGAGTVKDPVCEMDIEPQDAVATSEYKGKTYFFCAQTCKQSFDTDPAKYAHDNPKPLIPET
jgi:YHS domain-containing protein